VKEGWAAPIWSNIRTKFRENGLNHLEFKSGNSQMTYLYRRSVFFT